MPSGRISSFNGLSEQMMLRKLEGMSPTATKSPASTAASTPNEKENIFVQNDASPRPVGVPEGCIVRNTFLEWESEGDQLKCNLNGALRRQRSKSCTDSVLKQRHDVDSSPLSAPPYTPANGRGAKAEECDSYRSVRLPSEISRDFMTPPRQEYRYTNSDALSWRSTQSPSMSRIDSGYANNHSFKGSQKGYGKGGGPDVLVLRGLPFNAQEADVSSFINQAGLLHALADDRPIHLACNGAGKPTGFAEITLKPDANLAEVQEKLHMQRLGGRYIEVLPSRGTRMGAIQHRRERTHRRGFN